MFKFIRKSIEDLKPFNKIDIFFYLLLTIICYFLFQHPDLLHTGKSAYTLFRGHFLDFYEENSKIEGILGNNYLISTYILYVIWNLPIYIFKIIKNPYTDSGFVIFWYKALPLVFLIGSAFIIYIIGKLIGLSKKYSKLMVILWISSPILFFSQFIFGQYDIFTVFFTLLGIFFYLRNNRWLFILFFSISFTFKYFPLFIFIPLLFLVEKKPLYILRDILLASLLPLFEILPYLNSPSFITHVGGFGALGRAFSAGLNLFSGFNISVFIVGWAIISALAYLKEIKNNNEFIQWTLYLAMFSSSLLFAFLLWHPQWLLFATPFLAITTFIHKRANFFVLLDLVMMLFFVAFTVIVFEANVDQRLFALGILGNLQPHLTDPQVTFFMKNFFIYKDPNVYFSLISACFIINIIFKFPGMSFTEWEPTNFIFDIEKNKNPMRARFFLGVLFFVIPAIASFLLSFKNVIVYDTVEMMAKKTSSFEKIITGSSVGQAFETKGCKEIYGVAVKMDGFHSETKSGLGFILFEYGDKLIPDKILVQGELNTSLIVKENYFFITLKNVKVFPDKKYAFVFFVLDKKPGNYISVYAMPKDSTAGRTFAIINGKPASYDLVFKLFGRK